jgi:heat shock protein HspQ
MIAKCLIAGLKTMIAKLASPPPPRIPAPASPGPPAPAPLPKAAFGIGELVRHKHFPFRGVIYDVDPEFSNSEEWWQAIPETIRPAKDQPFYHLLAENEESAYVAYVSQQNLVHDENGEPVKHPAAAQIFEPFDGGRYKLRREHRH